ncbi:hypothetical protein BJV77DRAFT_575451 [Russula vinacea]|nr:hypothetical protein BJV77DRAFT_575451 [Russula vinacea]
MRHCVLVGPSVGWEGSDFESCGSVLETRRGNGNSRGTPSTISISSSSSSSWSSTSSLFPLRARRRRFFFCGLVGVCGRRFSFRRYGEGELLSLASEVTREVLLAEGKEQLRYLRNCRSKFPHACFPSIDASPVPLHLVVPLPWDQPSYEQKRCSMHEQDQSTPGFAPHPCPRRRPHHLPPSDLHGLDSFPPFPRCTWDFHTPCTRRVVLKCTLERSDECRRANVISHTRLSLGSAMLVHAEYSSKGT